ncbi:MAG: 50S ribosomal protein L11 methyltransferase [Ilumatobacteraceae bacterium]
MVTVDSDDADLASDALWTMGVVAIEERSIAGSVELWTSLGDDGDVVMAAASDRLAQWSWRIVEVDETVADTWRAHAVPVFVDPDLVICPAWVAFEPGAGVRVLRIEPGSTFGMGDHPTTMLSMSAIHAAMFEGARVLDVGCGSGVLSVGACVLGASHATAIDISPASIPVTRANAEANAVADRIEVSNAPLADIDGRFDIVVANILAPVLIDLADDVRRVVAAGGVVIISGVLADRHRHVEEALHPLRQTRRRTLDGWAVLTLQ